MEGGGGYAYPPIMSYTARLVRERISLFEVYIRGLGNLTLRSVKGPKRTNWRILRLFLVVYSYLKEGAFTTVKRDTAF